MIIKTIRVSNFRCIKDATLECDALTVLIGRNGSGKSSFLQALNLFYTSNAKYSEEDFYNRNISEPIRIAVTFGNLTEEEKKLFAPYLRGETLTVEKELAWPIGRGSQKYFGLRLRNPDFQQVRTAGKVADKREAYQKLVASGKFPGLPELPRNASEERIEEELQRWEREHPETLTWVRDDGQFFGFEEVGQARLERYTRFLLVPAVRDASEDATEGRGSVISKIMDLVVRSTLAEREDIKRLREETQKRYQEIIDPSRLTELQTLETRMTEIIGTFAPGIEIKLKWSPGVEIDIPMPQADVKVVEDGFDSAIERAGHAAQRAFILTALQYLAVVQAARERGGEAAQQSHSGVSVSKKEGTLTLPSLILGIEEPELYQHPSRQRHLAQVLLQLATGGIKGVAENIQIIYTTHSPLFVDLERFHQIRLVRKVHVKDDKLKQTKVWQTTWEEVTREIERVKAVQEGKFKPEGVLARLQTLMTPWTNEGFFADVVVLVEGEEDRAAILGVAKAMGHDLDGMDVAVIPCMGKPNLHKATIIFRKLGIPTYVIWDSDQGKQDPKVEENHCLLRLFGLPSRDYPEMVTDRFACFRVDLETTLKKELGSDLYQNLLAQCKDEFGYDNDNQAKKNPLIVQTIIKRASEKGKESSTLKQIVTKIVKLKEDIQSGTSTC